MVRQHHQLNGHEFEQTLGDNEGQRRLMCYSSWGFHGKDTGVVCHFLLQETEDEMVGLYHQLNGHEFEQTLGDSEGQGILVCCSPWGHKESDVT